RSSISSEAYDEIVAVAAKQHADLEKCTVAAQTVKEIKANMSRDTASLREMFVTTVLEKNVGDARSVILANAFEALTTMFAVEHAELARLVSQANANSKSAAATKSVEEEAAAQTLQQEKQQLDRALR